MLVSGMLVMRVICRRSCCIAPDCVEYRQVNIMGVQDYYLICYLLLYEYLSRHISLCSSSYILLIRQLGFFSLIYKYILISLSILVNRQHLVDPFVPRLVNIFIFTHSVLREFSQLSRKLHTLYTTTSRHGLLGPLNV